jgi:hypothetical protein
MCIPCLAHETVTRNSEKREKVKKKTVNKYLKMENLGKSDRHFIIVEGRKGNACLC